MRLSIIIPTLDEERRIAVRLNELEALADVHEILVVDGGSTDRTRTLATGFPRTRVLQAPRGRASQMLAGAREASGDTLLFLHADVALPDDAPAWVDRILSREGVVAGAFRTWTVSDLTPWRFAPLLHLADLRSRYTHLPYGDQAPFLRAETYWRVGGHPQLPLMEDLELSLRLRPLGKIVTAPVSVKVSGRRFVHRPFTYTFLVNVFPLLYRFGVPASSLAALYRNVR